MNGYIKNITSKPMYALKRHIPPGRKISLSELYKDYGEKHGLKEGVPFVEWLRKVKLPDTGVWEITLTDEPVVEEKPARKPVEKIKVLQMEDDSEVSAEDNKVTLVARMDVTEEPPTEKKPKEKSGRGAVPLVKKEYTPEELIELSLKEAKEVIPTLKGADVKLVAYALNLARQKPNKERITRMLEKHLDELKANL